MVTRPPLEPALVPHPCRICGRDAYLADERGPVHLCCSLLAVGHVGDCPACAGAEALRAAQLRRKPGQDARRRRARKDLRPG